MELCGFHGAKDKGEFVQGQGVFSNRLFLDPAPLPDDISDRTEHRFGFLKSANGGVAVLVEKPVVESHWEFVICSKSVFIPVDALSVGYFVFNYFNDGG